MKYTESRFPDGAIGICSMELLEEINSNRPGREMLHKNLLRIIRRTLVSSGKANNEASDITIATGEVVHIGKLNLQASTIDSLDRIKNDKVTFVSRDLYDVIVSKLSPLAAIGLVSKMNQLSMALGVHPLSFSELMENEVEVDDDHTGIINSWKKGEQEYRENRSTFNLELKKRGTLLTTLSVLSKWSNLNAK